MERQLRLGWQEGEPLPSAPTTTALYDGAGNRVQSVRSCGNCIGPGVITSYLGGLEEVTTAGTTTTTTAYYGSLAESVNGTLSYLLSDGLGSVSEAVSASTAQTTAMQLYGPYCAVREQSGTLPTDKGYTGQVSDAATSGLDYYGARYYDPVAGQFTSADTLLPQSTAQPDPGQFNRYAYASDNPETKTDPSGHCPWCIAVMGAIGIVVAVASVSQALAAGDANTVTFVRAGADIALGIGAGVALTADPVGGGIGLFGAAVGVAVQSKVSGHFDYQSAFESVAAGTIAGAVGGAAFGWVADSGAGAAVTGTASISKLAGQMAMQGTINATADLVVQTLGQANQIAAGQGWHPDLFEASIAFGSAALGGSMGEYMCGIGATGIRDFNSVVGGSTSFAGSVLSGSWAGKQQSQQQSEQQWKTGLRNHGRVAAW